ncbi:MAG: hypothetical protein QX196_15995 [Methylococcaceae bacterium]|jgi:hypothetical protein
MNIRFEYLYRDTGNFKSWGELVFSNPHNINVNLVKALAENVLIDQAYFVASKANVPDLHFKEYNYQLDHGWHELHIFVPTEEAPNDPCGRNIEEFIESLQFAASE